MDIRLVRGRNQRLWIWTLALVAISLVVWGSAFVFGDATNRPGMQVGAKANFGADRAPVVPMQSEAFERALPLDDRQLGRLLRINGTAESRTVRNAVWVRIASPRRWILVRVEPVPRGQTLRQPYFPGSAVQLQGYLSKISRAEFDAWIDSLRVGLPRPKPGVKFGDLPDSNFVRIDSLFIRDYYISVRPEAVRGGLAVAPRIQAAPPATAPAPRPATPAPATRPAPVLPDSIPAAGATAPPPTDSPPPAQNPPPDSAAPPPPR
jgi:hypothetical protein